MLDTEEIQQHLYRSKGIRAGPTVSPQEKIAVVYVRVSTSKQKDNWSVADQRGLTALATKYGFQHVEVREEQGISGEKLSNRPVMMSILEDIACGKVGAIIVANFSRISRDKDEIDGRFIKAMCRENGAVIITPEKLYDFQSELDDDLADFQFFFSKIQKRMNIKPMVQGAYRKAKEGGYLARPPSFGYDIVWKEIETPAGKKLKTDLAVNLKEAAVVRWIHDSFPTTFYRQTALALNERAKSGEGMWFPVKRKGEQIRKGRTERPWQEQDVRNIIKNRLYIGVVTYNENARSPYLRGLPPVYFYREDLRIVDQETWERNQRIAETRRQIPPRSKASKFAFSGLLRCPKCNGRMCGRGVWHNPKDKPGYVYKQYVCNAYNKSGTVVCEGSTVTDSVACKIILPILVELVQKNLRSHLDDVAGRGGKTILEEEEAGRIKAKILDIDRQVENLMRYAREGAITAEQLGQENFALILEKQRLEQNLKNLEKRRTTKQEIQTIMAAFDTDFPQVLAELAQKNPVAFNAFIRLFFEEITLIATLKGCGWRKGWKKGTPPPEERGRIVRFKLAPLFEEYVVGEGVRLPQALEEAEWVKHFPVSSETVDHSQTNGKVTISDSSDRQNFRTGTDSSPRRA